jgi:hypothetical protein
MKFRRSWTWEHFLHQAFTYIKLAEAFLYYQASVRAAAFFAIYCIIVWVLSRNPVYPRSLDSPGLIKVVSLEHFYFLVGALTDQGELKFPPPTETTVASKKRAPKTENQKDYSKIQHTLVIFGAGWNDNCYFTQSLWDKLAKRFTTGKLKFIEVDILKFDSLARLYRVATTGFEKCLPVLILFEDGK